MEFIGVAKGKRIELAEMLPYAEGQVVRILVEPIEEQLQLGVPLAIRQMMHASPHLEWEDVDELERIMSEGKLPVYQESVFDEGEVP